MSTVLSALLRSGAIGTFKVALPATVTFGYGCRGQIPEIAARHGSRPLFVVGRGSLKASGLLHELVEATREAGLEPHVFEGVEAEPLVGTVDSVRELLLDQDCDLVIAIGGGSVIDVGKAAAALIDSDHPTKAHLAGEPLPEEGLPHIAAPTTAGTGAEVTPNAVLRDLEAAVKASLRGDTLLPVAAVVDPQLTMGAPPHITAHSGLDALAQALEAYTSLGANPFTDALALEAALRVGAWLPLAYRDGNLWPARENVALGSLFAGIALASARLGLVHGLAHPLGLLHDIPHGLVCALLLPYVMEFNLPACEAKYAVIARAVGAGADGEALVAWVRKLAAEVGVRETLTDYGLRAADCDRIIPAAMESGSTKHNPREVTEDDLRELLTRMIGV